MAIVDPGIRDIPRKLREIIDALSNRLTFADNFGGEGNVGQVLVSQGSDRPPTFQDADVAGGTATKTTDASELISGILPTARLAGIYPDLVIEASQLPAHTHAETDIVDGALLARLAANETITGTWTFGTINALKIRNYTQTDNYLDLDVTYPGGGGDTSDYVELVGNKSMSMRINRSGAVPIGHYFRVVWGGGLGNEAFRVLDSGELWTSGDLKRAGTKILGVQGAAVSDAVGGGTVDAEARTAINTLLSRIRDHGLIAT
jgi:hypothetical protein